MVRDFHFLKVPSVNKMPSLDSTASQPASVKQALEKERNLGTHCAETEGRRRWMKISMAVLCSVAAIGCIVALVLTVGGAKSNKNEPLNSPTAAPSSKRNNSNIFDGYGDFDGGYGDFDGVASVTSNYNILQVFDHDPTAFTQGLYYHNQLLVESTGNYGKSLVRIWDPETGQVIRQTPLLDSAYFGEGLAWYRDANGNERYIQLTWQEQTAFLYDTELSLLDSFKYQTTTTDGWGITFDPLEQVFYVSDGSAYIHVWNLEFQEIRRFRVTRQDSQDSSSGTREISDINELEWDPTDGTILANVWYKDFIVRIWPQTGQILQVYDLGALESGGGNVLNGIAYHSNNTWWITGKLWSNLYLIEFFE
jgi:glutamine cyclotransferase